MADYTVMWSANDGVHYMDFEALEDAVCYVERMKEWGYDDAHVLSLSDYYSRLGK